MFLQGLIFSRFSDKSDGHGQKVSTTSLISNLVPTPFASLVFTVVVAASLKMPVERSSALELRVMLYLALYVCIKRQQSLDIFESLKTCKFKIFGESNFHYIAALTLLL